MGGTCGCSCIAFPSPHPKLGPLGQEHVFVRCAWSLDKVDVWSLVAPVAPVVWLVLAKPRGTKAVLVSPTVGAATPPLRASTPSTLARILGIVFGPFAPLLAHHLEVAPRRRGGGTRKVLYEERVSYTIEVSHKVGRPLVNIELTVIGNVHHARLSDIFSIGYKMVQFIYFLIILICM